MSFLKPSHTQTLTYSVNSEKMPIEIRELHIKAEVKSGGEQPAAPANVAAIKNKIVAECVEQVLQILKDKKER